MKRCLLIVLIIGLSLAGLCAKSKSFDYSARWKEADKLWKKGLYKTMAEKVDAIYAQAARENKTDQQVKALIYSLMAIQMTEDESIQTSIQKINALLRDAKHPASAVLHSILGELYWQYYTSNRWRFQNRGMPADNHPDDIATWDLRTIASQMIREFRLSLENVTALQAMNIGDFPAMLYPGGAQERALRPTLYDFLAHRALSYFQSTESGIALPNDTYTLSDPLYFAAADVFCQAELSTPDSLSLQFHAIRLHQDLLRFHLRDADPSALIEVDVDRLRYVYKNSVMANRDSLYVRALRHLQDRYAEYPGSALASFALAQHLRARGDNYDPKVSDANRWSRKEALEICEQASREYPKSFGGRSCATLATSIRHPIITLQAEAYVPPDKPIKALLSLKNLAGVEIRIYPIQPLSIKTALDDEYYYWSKGNYRKVKALWKKKPVWKGTFQVENEGDFRKHSYELALASLPAGRYMVVAANLADQDHPFATIMGFCPIECTPIAYAVSAAGTGTVLVADRDSGAPLEGAVLSLYSEESKGWFGGFKYVLKWTGTSDANGIVTVPYDDGFWTEKADINYNGTILHIPEYNIYWYNEPKAVEEKCLLFTDRALYRPGQDIYVKGVVYIGDGIKKNELMPGKDITVEFHDSTSRLVDSKPLTTNEYATFSCVFKAPQNGLNGDMYICVGNSRASFSVEEYKRPAFEVKLSKPSESFALNNPVSVEGKAVSYAGIPLDGATVVYNVSRTASYPYRPWWSHIQPASPTRAVANGTLITDADGSFRITFIALADDAVPSGNEPLFIFQINASVTDTSGETRGAELNLQIGTTNLILDAGVAANVDRNQKRLAVPLSTRNFANESVASTGNIRVSRLQNPDHVMKQRMWEAPDRNYLSRDEFRSIFPTDIYATDDDVSTWAILDTVCTLGYSSPGADTLYIEGINRWEPGVYLLQAEAASGGLSASATRYFTLYDSGSDALPYPMADWFVPVKTVCEPGESALILIGSAYPDCRMRVDVEKDKEIVESRWIELDKAQKLLEFPVTEADRGGFFVHVTWFKDGRFYAHDQEIAVPWSNKRLSFEYLSFRDKLLPGEQEEWRVKIRDNTGGNATAELLASMYDASLDAFIKKPWTANVFGNNPMMGGWETSTHYKVDLRPATAPKVTDQYPMQMFDSLNWYGVNSGLMLGDIQSVFGTLHIRGGRANEVDFSIDGMSVSEPIYLDGYVAEYGEAQSGVINITTKDLPAMQAPSPAEPPAMDMSAIPARANFRETAFFYPSLHTDENGEVSISFTTPEALTRWKFRALALSKDFRIGITENIAVTQKPFMAQALAPRFFREGDSIVFTAKVTALEADSLSGTCRLFLYDAATMQPIDPLFGLTGAHQQFVIDGTASTTVSWDLSVPSGIGAVQYRVVASSGDHSDGEENAVPILPRRIMVTESLPLPVPARGSMSYVFQKLRDNAESPAINHHRLILEYTSNPLWYVVQALPYLMEYPYDCNEQIFSRYYANSLAAHILVSDPRIKAVFDEWINAPAENALLPRMEQNSELKDLLLEETPWALDALDTASDNHRLGSLFDAANLSAGLQAAAAKLFSNQSSSGAWPWFPGMSDSRWVTQYIVEGFGHLRQLGVNPLNDDKRRWYMLLRAVEYLDKAIVEDYEDIKRDGDAREDNLGYLQLHYLYARSFYGDIALSGETETAIRYFQDQAQKYWRERNPYGQGMIALVLHRSGDRSTPQGILASLKEQAQYSDEMGMSWKQGERYWQWDQAPLETQSLLIEAFSEIQRDTISVDMMRTWLLKNKQTTNWKSTKATAEACYALLVSGSDWQCEDQLADIRLGDIDISATHMDSAEAGSGYIKVAYPGEDITPQMGDVSITNPNYAPSWGALYWQYFADLDSITAAESPLKISKHLFKELVTDRGRVLTPVYPDTELHLGDKIVVRIELRSDRDMEYVHLKDMRAAGLEPINVLSEYKRQAGFGYYEETGDAATNFFIDYLPKGTYVFEYPLRVTHRGEFANGIATIQCMYTPEFRAHTPSAHLLVK